MVSLMSGDSDQNPAEEVELFSFPCRFQIKVMGRQSEEFDTLVSKVVSRHLDGAAILDVSTRESSGASYVSVNCTIEAMSRQQLDAIYLDLNSESDVLVTL
jgi:putative lipoic acid-binding regulatory protein